MMKILLSLLFVFLALYGSDKSVIEVFSLKDVVMLEKGILSEALPAKDYKTISTIAFSFLSASRNKEYSGDRDTLYKRSIELLRICHKGGYLTSSLFLVKSFLLKDPRFCRKIGFEAISIHRENGKSRYSEQYNNIVMIYISSVLDNVALEKVNKDEINFSIEALQTLPVETPQTKFFTAFLFKAIGVWGLADTYLNEACHASKEGGKIYNYCLNGEDIIASDLIESKVKGGCKKDIGERCE
jgi:hypothetical protein